MAAGREVKAESARPPMNGCEDLPAAGFARPWQWDRGGGVDNSHKVIAITLLNQDAQVLDVF